MFSCEEASSEVFFLSLLENPTVVQQVLPTHLYSKKCFVFLL
jgi:hypothetical protein